MQHCGLHFLDRSDFMPIRVVHLLLFQPLVKFKSHFYYEEKDHVAEAEKQLKPLKGSKVWNCSDIHVDIA